MTISVTLGNLANLTNENTAVSTINNNSALITTGFTSALDTLGDKMLGTLDMNSNQILNLPSPGSNNSPVRLTDLTNAMVTGTVVFPTVIGGTNISTSGTGTITISTVTSPTWTTATISTLNSNSITAITIGVSTLSATTIAGNTVYSGNAYFKSGQPWVDVKAYGAKGDGVTNDTAAISSAIANVPSGGVVYLSDGLYLVGSSTASTPIFTISQPTVILGNGINSSQILVGATTPTSSDIFHIVGITNESTTDYRMEDFAVNAAVAGAVGLNCFHFDSTAGTTTNFELCVLRNVYCDPNVSSGGYSIFLDNGVGTNTNGGMSLFTVEFSFLGGGIGSSYTGDTIRVLNNLIHTANAAVYLSQVAGAGNFFMQGNNVSGQGGGVKIVSAVAPVIVFNEFEQQATNTEANNSIIAVEGLNAQILSAKILGNQVQANASTGNPTLIYIGNAKNTVVDYNYLGTPSSYTNIVCTASSAGTVIGAGNYSITGTLVSDSSGSNIYMFPQVYTVTSLPASSKTGQRAIVTDATATTFMSTPTGSASTIVPVVYTGSGWRIG